VYVGSELGTSDMVANLLFYRAELADPGMRVVFPRIVKEVPGVDLRRMLMVAAHDAIASMSHPYADVFAKPEQVEDYGAWGYVKDPHFASSPGSQYMRYSFVTVSHQLAFEGSGLIPVVIQDHATKRVLILGSMNRLSLDITLNNGEVFFWSKFRNELRHKGATSGDYLKVKGVEVNCERNSLLIWVESVTGSACHTGATSCFDLPCGGGVRKLVLTTKK
jgi:phosphoribosyl-AMP cyclohydrolase